MTPIGFLIYRTIKLKHLATKSTIWKRLKSLNIAISKLDFNKELKKIKQSGYITKKLFWYILTDVEEV